MKIFTIHIKVILLMMLTSQSFSATINVPADQPTIQAGINNASTGDIVLIASGTYNEAINFNGKAITVRSASGNPADVTINGTGNFHVVQCISGEDPNTVLEGVTITGGNANGSGVNSVGGGMFNSNSSPTVTHCVFDGNQAGFGGGMFNDNSSPTVTNSVFSGNTADIHGGGMVNNDNTPTVMNCDFSGNTANFDGGGIYNTSSSSPTVTNCVFSGNTATNHGGGMANETSSPIITNCVFDGNIATSDGGGIYFFSGSGFITNATFVNNVSGGNGGGVFTTGVTTHTMISSIFWQNSDSGGMDTSAQIHVDSGSVEVNYSNVMGGWIGLGTGNINADPLFVDADGPDDDPNTPADNNFRLSFGSPCIDAGDSSAVPVGVVTDLDGNPRKLDDTFTVDTGVGFPTVDMGAYEFPPVRNLTQATNYFSLQAAIDAAVDGDVIEAGPQTYFESINFQGKAITLRSASGDPNDTIIDGTGHFHVVQCVSSEDPNTLLQGFTITGGNANGIAANRLGGGMYNANSSPTVTNCVFSGNQADVGGGGMYNFNSSPTVTHCVFNGNTANFVGTGAGGGMLNDSNSSPTVTHCVFSGNQANIGGGGMYNFGSSPTITNGVFSGNTANEDGGGMLNDTSSPTVTNCVFSGNTANFDGGGMYNGVSSPTMTNCVFSGNTATSDGGGVYNWNSSPTVTSSIFWQNSDSGGMDTSAQIDVFGSTVEVNYSNVMGGWLGLGTGNINADPLFVDADGPDDNPATFADNNVRLSFGSPCIDAGDSSALPIGVVTDLDGNPRQLDEPFTIDTGVGFPTVDMGAYEFDFSKACQLMNKGDLNCDGIINIFDFAIKSANWLVSQ